jgi:hypothetical protein
MSSGTYSHAADRVERYGCDGRSQSSRPRKAVLTLCRQYLWREFWTAWLLVTACIG